MCDVYAMARTEGQSGVLAIPSPVGHIGLTRPHILSLDLM